MSSKRHKTTMLFRNVLFAALVVISTAISLSSCHSSLPTSRQNTQDSSTTVTSENTEVSISNPADSSDSGIPAVQGADSVKTLLEKSLDYLHSGCDYAKIADVRDQQACIAYVLIRSLYETDYATETCTEITWEEAMEKAALFFGDARTLQDKDPELTQRLTDLCVLDLDEGVGLIREAISEGDISEDDPYYEMCSNILIDWDKGSDYIAEHYQEELREILFGGYMPSGVFFRLDDVLEYFRSYARGESISNDSDVMNFRGLTAEYRPENTEVGRNGSIFIYDIGSVWNGEYKIDMLYYVKDAVYYLIDYRIVVY